MRRLTGVAVAALITILATMAQARLEPVVLSRADASQLAGTGLGTCAATTIDFCAFCAAPTCWNFQPFPLAPVCTIVPWTGNDGSTFSMHFVCEGYLGLCGKCTCATLIKQNCPAFIPPGPACPPGGCLNAAPAPSVCDC